MGIGEIEEFLERRGFETTYVDRERGVVQFIKSEWKKKLKEPLAWYISAIKCENGKCTATLNKVLFYPNDVTEIYIPDEVEVDRIHAFVDWKDKNFRIGARLHFKQEKAKEVLEDFFLA